MTAGARTLSIEETLLEPPALPPPPTRHALFVILIALAALLHVVTIGTGDLYSETEGQYAGAAREMVGEPSIGCSQRTTAYRACKNRHCSTGSSLLRTRFSA